MIDFTDISVAIIFASFAVYGAVLLAEMWDPQASRWPM
jgi:hypothetical protein